LVYLVEDWKVLEGYAGFKQGFCQVIEDKKATEIRVKVGKLDFKGKFQNEEDLLLNKILDFCKSKNCIEVSSNITDDYFFKYIGEVKRKKR